MKKVLTGLFLHSTIIIAVVAIIVTYFKQYRIKELLYGGITQCPIGHFHLTNTTSCHVCLKCEDIHKITTTDRLLGQGAVKKVYLGTWQGHPVAVSYLRDPSLYDDFLHNLHMLQTLSPQQSKSWLVQLIGWCLHSQPVLVTEYHPLGTADGIHEILKTKFINNNTMSTRFRLCVEYLQILKILHSQSGGPRVLCDTNNPSKTLSQFLISSNLSLILNDVDALPQVDTDLGKFIKCGHRELTGEFVAPEQLWPFEHLPYNDTEMHGYDEKSDIWKIPNVCNELIGNCKGAASLRLHLFSINSKCKSLSPSERPSIEEVLRDYLFVQKNVNLNNVC